MGVIGSVSQSRPEASVDSFGPVLFESVDVPVFIHDLAGQHTIVLSTHILPEVSQICDRVVIINAGRVVLEENLGSLPAGKSLEDVFLEAISKEEGHEVAEAEETLEEVGAGHA